MIQSVVAAPSETTDSCRLTVDKGIITLVKAQSGAIICASSLSRWGITKPTQDRLRHLALDCAAACVAGNGGREHSVDPNSPVSTSDEGKKSPPPAGTITATIEHGVVFIIQRDTYTNGRYEALIVFTTKFSRSNQSLEPTAGRSAARLKEELRIMKGKTFALASGGSSCSRQIFFA